MNKKHPKIAGRVEAKKQPKIARGPYTPENLTWSFCLLDEGGQFGWSKCDQRKFLEILQKKKSFESMTFQDLGRSGCHAIQVSEIGKEARDRLVEIRHDDIDELYSLRLNGSNRIICIQHASVMRVLWWDPDHGVYPCPKKHT